MKCVAGKVTTCCQRLISGASSVADSPAVGETFVHTNPLEPAVSAEVGGLRDRLRRSACGCNRSADEETEGRDARDANGGDTDDDHLHRRPFCEASSTHPDCKDNWRMRGSELREDAGSQVARRGR